MQKRKIEIAVGVFVVFGLAALVMLAVKVSNLAAVSEENGYVIKARFTNIGGLKVRAPVLVGGVRVGKVADVTLDSQTYEAVVVMDVSSKYKNLPKDTSASIFTAGLLGEQYVGLDPGGDTAFLKNGDEIKLTQAAFVMEQVLGQFLFSKASGDKAPNE